MIGGKRMDEEKKVNPDNGYVINFSEYKRKREITYLENYDKIESYPEKAIYITWPTDFDDAILIIDEMLKGNTILMNLFGMEHYMAQRLVDFISGACYSLEYMIAFISDNIFIITYQESIQAVK